MSDIVADLEFWLDHPDGDFNGPAVKVPADVLKIAIAIIREHRRTQPSPPVTPMPNRYADYPLFSMTSTVPCTHEPWRFQAGS